MRRSSRAKTLIQGEFAVGVHRAGALVGVEFTFDQFQ